MKKSDHPEFDFNARAPDFSGSRFNGAAYDPAHDDPRLENQLTRIFALMKDGLWRTLAEIELTTGDPQASISAQLRHLRKERFGSYCIERRARGDREHGLFEYRIKPPELEVDLEL